jgi:3-hydroxyacyl-CoA dehydrogenase/3-hydroxy-2-methylbutyryl-CoA dehydrogenase
VTGGASGLGLATVQAYLAKGAKVAIWDLNAEQGAIVAAELGLKRIVLSCECGDEASVQAAIAATVAKFGGIHITVNCAGIGSAMRTVGKNGPMPLRYF